jgi:serine/threonine protein kinase
MEYAIGGSLYDQLKHAEVFTEETAKFYTAEITLALEYLHRNGILHR